MCGFAARLDVLIVIIWCRQLELPIGKIEYQCALYALLPRWKQFPSEPQSVFVVRGGVGIGFKDRV
jgi:hypothetical protein